MTQDPAALPALFAAQRAAFAQDPFPDAPTRERRLATLEALVRTEGTLLARAISRDFGNRSFHETQLLELFPSLNALKHARRHLRRWMRPQRRPVALWFQPGRAQLRPQPLGVAGIVVPWNYPLYLTFGPLAGAVAAGNRVLLKLSEWTPETSALLARLIHDRFDPAELAVVEGDATIAEAFVRLPFDHLLFTGSTAVGHHVMRAAADHLTPVTLELGGKSPALVGPGADLARAAERILVGKTMNAGQTCIAPDYALVPRARVEAFVAQLAHWSRRLYPEMRTTPDYTTIAHERHFDRLLALLDEARTAGATITNLGGFEPERGTRRFPALAVTGAPAHLRLLREEIFGPILPVLPYDTLDEALAWINARPRPLALYVFDDSRPVIDRVLDRTVAGGVTVNDTILHVAQDELPFGGVGPSGMGQYHGHAGFRTFSHFKPVFWQPRLNGFGCFRPPYGPRFEALVRFVLR